MSTPDDDWRALGAGTRRVAWQGARRLRAHPDPVVSGVAARYARWYLDARTWPARPRRLAIGLLLADVLAAAAVLGWRSGGPVTDRPGALEKTLIWLVAIVIALGVLAPYAVRKFRIIRRYRLELANRLTLESVAVASAAWAQPPTAGQASAGLGSAAGRDVSVRYDRRRVARQCAWVLVIMGLMLAGAVGQGLSAGLTPVSGVLCGSFVLCAVLVVPRMVLLLVHWVLPGRPIVDLDAEGVHMPSIGCELPWAWLAEVRLVPMRYARRGDQGAVVVAFVPRDPSAVLDSVPGGSRRRKRLERSLRVYGTPLSICDNVVDHSGEQIAAAAATFAAVPVHRY
ncbi:MAG: hypothetical protein ACRDOI_41270 [Trebonia sp.]